MQREERQIHLSIREFTTNARPPLAYQFKQILSTYCIPDVTVSAGDAETVQSSLLQR